MCEVVVFVRLAFVKIINTRDLSYTIRLSDYEKNQPFTVNLGTNFIKLSGCGVLISFELIYFEKISENT